jgi:hypothetical protein
MTEEFDQSLHGLAVLLARGYLRLQASANSQGAQKPTLASVPTCLLVSAENRLSVPSGLRLGESETPRNDHQLEDDKWQWM